MMMKKTFVMAMVVATGCMQADDDQDELEPKLAEYEVIVENLIDAGFPENDIMVLEDGRVVVGRDAVVTLQASRELAGVTSDGAGDEFRQYRTDNTVNPAVVGTICITTSADFDSYPSMRDAVDLAIDRYNAEGLVFTFGRDGAGCNAGTADAVIAGQLDNSGGGVSGFPAGGLPYNEFFVDRDLADQYGINVAAHVIMHELGHCIGFRHTDYYNRSISCGGAPTDEGDGGVGAIHIDGTPTTAVLGGSVMNSCYSSNSTGLWTPSDVTALDCLYDTLTCAPPPPPTYDIAVDTQTNQSAGKRVKTYYGPYDASTYSAMRFQTIGANGDADLYVREGSNPTNKFYDCISAGPSSNESCELDTTAGGSYYVMVLAYSAYSGLTFDVDASN